MIKATFLACICFAVGHYFGSMSMLTVHGNDIDLLRINCFEPLDSLRAWHEMVLNDWVCEIK